MKLIIKELNEIDTKSAEGRLLLAAIAHISCTTRSNKTPNEVIAELQQTANTMFSEEMKKLLKDFCPECGIKLTPEGGCSFCHVCGYSQCK